MKQAISFIAGLITFFFALGWANDAIQWITSSITDGNFRAIMVIVLWVVGFSTIVGISILAAIMIGSLIRILLGK